jgi:hypothetical protein
MGVVSIPEFRKLSLMSPIQICLKLRKVLKPDVQALFIGIVARLIRF